MKLASSCHSLWQYERLVADHIVNCKLHVDLQCSRFLPLPGSLAMGPPSSGAPLLRIRGGTSKCWESGASDSELQAWIGSLNYWHELQQCQKFLEVFCLLGFGVLIESTLGETIIAHCITSIHVLLAAQ